MPEIKIKGHSFRVSFEPIEGFRTHDPEITNHVLWPTELYRQVGKLSTSRRYNRLPLLRSNPGDSQGAGRIGLTRAQKVDIFS